MKLQEGYEAMAAVESLNAPNMLSVTDRPRGRKADECGLDVKLFVGDASRMGCQLIAAALQRGPRLNVLGYAMDSDSVLSGLGACEADVAIISARLSNGSVAGFDVVRKIRASRPKINFIMMLDSTDRPLVVEAFRAGACGIISREESFEVLCKSIHAVHQGQVWANSKELRFVLDALAHGSPSDGLSGKKYKGSVSLTKREEDVIHLVSEGLTNREISVELGLSAHTIRNYLFRIFNKLGTSTRLELALYAVNHKERIRRDWLGHS